MEAHPAMGTESDILGAIYKVVVEKKASGTGFLVHDRRHILTALHVVKNAPQGKITIQDAYTGEMYTATIQCIIEKWDIALLRLDEPLKDVTPFSLLHQELHSGTKIRTYGFPANFGNHWHLGEISGELKNGKIDILFSTQYPDSLKGLSGGPVFHSDDEAYTIAGVIVEQDLNNLQMGTIVPTECFYEEIIRVLNIEESLEDMPWCYVILSEMEEITSKPYKLKETVYNAMKLLTKDNPSLKEYIGGNLEHVHFSYATDLVSSQEAYEKAVGKLCQTRIAIFDVTHFEPAVMLFLGIRSVVRRGITVASHGGNFMVGEIMDFPFNIKEVNVISHSKKQQDQRAKKPAQLISNEIREGLNQLENMPQYLDLPTFDAIRNLPPGSREPDAKNVLVLCPYSKIYQAKNWKLISDYMEINLPQDAKALRNMDVDSPRLISHTIYQHIRRNILCIVDWTEWRPNVFFEFGVRLAVTSTRRFTVSILEDRHRQLVQEISQNHEEFKKDETQLTNLISKLLPDDMDEIQTAAIRERYFRIAQQCVFLLQLFDPKEYNCPSVGDVDDQFDSSEFEDMVYYYPNKEGQEMPPRDKKGLAPYFTYKVIQELIDPMEEALSVPVYIELKNAAYLFDVDDTDGRKAILYPEKEALMQSVELGITQRLLAAWYFIRNEYKDQDILNDKELLSQSLQISRRLRDHIKYDESRKALVKKINEFIDYCNNGEEIEHDR